jgi:hypothetical protein
MLSVAPGASWRGMFFDWIGRKEYFNKFLAWFDIWPLSKAVQSALSIRRIYLTRTAHWRKIFVPFFSTFAGSQGFRASV